MVPLIKIASAPRPIRTSTRSRTRWGGRSATKYRLMGAMTQRITDTTNGVFQPCPAPDRKMLSVCTTAARPRPIATRERGEPPSLIAKVAGHFVGAQQFLDVV